MSRRNPNHLTGFTLVEMLVSLSIFSMLVAVLMAGFSQSLSLWERASSKSTTWLVIENRYELLRQLFIQSRLADYRGTPGITYPHFIGGKNQVEFTTGAPILDLNGRIRPVRISVERGENGESTFFYEEADRYNDQGRGIDWDKDRRVLFVANLYDPAFRYMAPAFPLPTEFYIAELTRDEQLRYRDAPEWLDWYDTSILLKAPLLIELKFTDEDGDAHLWSFRVPTEMDAWSLNGKLDE